MNVKTIKLEDVEKENYIQSIYYNNYVLDTEYRLIEKEEVNICYKKEKIRIN
jgi:hypothetical protein